MKYPTFQNVKVRCPQTQKIELIQIKTLPIEEHLIAPVQGCENLTGCTQCQRCCAALTLMFQNGLEYFPFDIISPDFSILK